MTEKLYSTTQVAQILQMSAVGVRTKALRHNIGQLVGKRWVFTAADIEALRAAPDRRKKAAEITQHLIQGDPEKVHRLTESEPL